MLKKMVSGVMFTLLVFAMMALLIHVKPAISTEDNWWNSNWTYRRQVNITERSGYSLVNFPVQVTFEHMGHIQTDGNDIRVIDNGMEVPFAIENINSTHATIIFEVNVSALASKSLFIYYGNPRATKPAYPPVPLIISEGNNGYAIIDNALYIGWNNTIWAGTGPNVTIWADYKIDFDRDGDPRNDYDLITDDGSHVSGIFRRGGIGRYSTHEHKFGLGNYQRYTQTPIYVDIIFASATLRAYKNHIWVETTQADKLWMFSSSWNYAKHGGGSEENIVDGVGWTEIYNSPVNPGWMAYRNSNTGIVFAATGFGIGQGYNYTISAKEDYDWDRAILFDYNKNYFQVIDPYDQPSDAKIYWYGDNSNDYSGIERIAQILNNQPSIIVESEETVIEVQVLNATLDINPNTLSLRSEGKWITAYIELPEGYKVEDINVSSIMLNETIPALPMPIRIGDYDNDTIPDMMVKFDRQAVIQYIINNIDIEELFEKRFITIALTITGYLYDGTLFQGTDTIRIIMPMPRCWKLQAKLGIYPY